MNILRFAFCILLAAFLWMVGCAAPNPLIGWHLSSMDNLRANQNITEDCRIYVQQLPSEQKGFVESIEYFEDGKGQHAVDIKIGLNGTLWEHVLIYNKENQRIKVVKHKSGG